MPIICTEHTQGVSSEHSRVSPSRFVPVKKAQQESQIRDVIEQLFKGLQAELLLKMIAWSFQGIRTEFLPPGSDDEIVALEHEMHGASQNARLTIFFFLLNMHMELKDYILEIDPHNSRKLVRFMSDLRRFEVVRFCSNETLSVDEFVESVYQCYILA